MSPPPSPPQISHLGGDGKKNFSALTHRPRPPNLGPSLRQWFTAHAQKRLFRRLELPVKNMTSPFAPATSIISYKTAGCISTTEWRLRDIFGVFVLLRRMTLWPWALTFWPWECFTYSATHMPENPYQFLLSYDKRNSVHMLPCLLTGNAIAITPILYSSGNASLYRSRHEINANILLFWLLDRIQPFYKSFCLVKFVT